MGVSVIGTIRVTVWFSIYTHILTILPVAAVHVPAVAIEADRGPVGRVLNPTVPRCTLHTKGGHRTPLAGLGCAQAEPNMHVLPNAPEVVVKLPLLMPAEHTTLT